MNVHVTKTVPIEFKMVVDAYSNVRKGGMATGIDGESWAAFDEKLQDNLYIIWNRLASGSYHPSAVREVEIPKKDGKIRKLGIPTLRDRIAQDVVRKYMEQRIDQHFHNNSYGYRPLKSSRQAIEQVRINCKQIDWVIDLDISKFFDEIDHELLLKAVSALIKENWVLLYVERWLKMKIIDKAGNERERGSRGTPQGGVISPLLANLFLHFALDKWLGKRDAGIRFVRYADDVIIHCNSKQAAEELLEAIKQRMSEVKLSLNEGKTKIVYCQDYPRKERHDIVKFEFLGFSFQPRRSKMKQSNRSYKAYTAEINKENQKRITQSIKETIAWRNRIQEIGDIATALNDRLRGWINYFGLYGKGELRKVMLRLDRRLLKWLQSKHKVPGKRETIRKLDAIRKQNPRMFYHWEKRYCYIVIKK